VKKRKKGASLPQSRNVKKRKKGASPPQQELAKGTNEPPVFLPL
jgi:hypothetical protein